MKNVDIRNAISSAHIRCWQVADLLGMNDGNFSRKLRHELPQEEKEKIFKIVRELAINRAIK